MSETKRLVASIVTFLRTQLEAGLSNTDAYESLEVGIQCLESAFELKPEDTQATIDLLEMFKKNDPSALCNDVTDEAKEQAEALKNEGNTLMKAEKYAEALEKYTQAIALHKNNSIFYCNRAASHFYLLNDEQAIKDCNTAISLNPRYARAYGRLGLSLTKLDRHKEAKQAYEKALELEPENEGYKNNLALSMETLASQAVDMGPSGMNLEGLLQNPSLMSVATQMLADPEMQNLMSGLLGNVGGNPAMNNPAGINALLQAGQQLAAHMQQANPDLVEQLRSQMGGPNPPNPPQPPKDAK